MRAAMAAVDAATLDKLMVDLGDDPEVMRELVETFLQEGPRIVGEMQTALEKRDQRTLHRTAHSLKSTSATFGAGALSRLCRDLERESEQEVPEHAEVRVRAIVAEWALVKAALEAWKPRA